MSSVISYRIGLHEVDAGGVVFYGTLFTIAHQAYEQALAGSTMDLATVVTEGRIALPLVHAEADFLQPIHHGDRLDLRVACSHIGTSSYRIRITFHPAAAPEPIHQRRVLAAVTQVHALVDRVTGSAIPVDDSLRAALESAALADEPPR